MKVIYSGTFSGYIFPSENLMFVSGLSVFGNTFLKLASIVHAEVYHPRPTD